jgi:methanogenic corrinoid protein MtbC1
MTLLWCAYCQEFQGEKPPFDHLAVSHGICEKCRTKVKQLQPSDLEGIQRLNEVMSELWSAGSEGRFEAAAPIIEKAKQAGLQPIEILIGAVSPLLQKVGELWSEGRITVTEEHRYTAFAERVLTLIETQMPHEDRTDALFLSTDGNFHSLGPRIIALWCASKGIAAKSVYPAVPKEEVPGIVEKLHPQVLGLSISMPEQIPAVEKIVEAVRALPNPPRIVLGVYAVKQGRVPEIPGTTQLLDGRELIRQLKGA